VAATIKDDDAPPVVSVSAPSVVEGNTGSTTLTFAVTLMAASSRPVTIDYATAAGTATAGSDYSPVSGTLTFAPGESSRVISVTVFGDTLHEADESLSLALSNPVNASIGTAAGTGVITNDDAAPTVSVDSPWVYEGDTGATGVPFTVSLSGPSGLPITVNFATADGTAVAGADYTAAAGGVTFAPGETSKTVTVFAGGDNAAEADETFALNLALPHGTSATLGTPAVVGTIRNDDYAPVANAGPDRTVNEAATVTFGGSGSTDADGDPLTYFWDFGDGSTGTGVSPTHIYADNGTYTVTLTVSDGPNSSTDTATVAVRNVAPNAGVAGPASGVRGQSRTFTLTASDPSPADQASAFRYRVEWGRRHDRNRDRPRVRRAARAHLHRVGHVHREGVGDRQGRRRERGRDPHLHRERGRGSGRRPRRRRDDARGHHRRRRDRDGEPGAGVGERGEPGDVHRARAGRRVRAGGRRRRELRPPRR
jgi:PKD repeat protein